MWRRKVTYVLYRQIQGKKDKQNSIMAFVNQWNRDIFMQKRFNIGENSLVCKYYWSVTKVLSDSKHRIMQKNQSSTLNSLTSTFPSSLVGKGRGFRHHWASDFYAYTFATLLGIFAPRWFAIIVRQCKQPSGSRIVHSHFTTVQILQRR